MGVYAQTDFEIEVKNKKAGQEVIKALKALNKKGDENHNSFGSDLHLLDNGKCVVGFESSGRYQNLEYRCEKIWEAIKNIKGVFAMNAPFMSEADGCFFSNEEEIAIPPVKQSD